MCFGRSGGHDNCQSVESNSLYWVAFHEEQQKIQMTKEKNFEQKTVRFQCIEVYEGFVGIIYV